MNAMRLEQLVGALNDAVSDEGWALFYEYEGAYRIERDDEAAVFSTDAAAADHVRCRAEDGSTWHIVALYINQENGS